MCSWCWCRTVSGCCSSLKKAGRQVDDGVDAAGRHVLSCVTQCGPDDALRLTHSCQERLQNSSHVPQISPDRAVSAAETRLTILTSARGSTNVETSAQGQSRSVRVLSQRAIWRHPPPSSAPNKQLPQAANRSFDASRVHRFDMASGARSHQDR